MRRPTRFLTIGCVLAALAASAVLAGQRVPGEHWMRFTDPREAGFDPAKLEAARETWESLPSSAFMVVADGAVVAAWGDTGRRFMCHSVRKSFLSALYGIFWDRGEIDLNKTMADLGIDDSPDPLLPSERQARILDLIKARSGVFHPAAYAGRTDSAPRGSKGAGRYFAYNNWDFNTLATILMQETGHDVFEAFDRYFGQPLGLEDWRVSDGYYHYERDKSRYPAYPFRLSARDAARFGLLFTREGLWGDTRILSKNWVRRSSALYSIDDEIRGYGFMWWIYREPRFENHGMYAALGVGNQMIAALPESDLVIVNRANTYQGEGTPDGPLRDLIGQVLAARVGEPVDNPRLEPLEVAERPNVTSVLLDRLMGYVGTYAYPPKALELPLRTRVEYLLGDGHLVAHSPVSGTFAHYLQPDGTLFEEDSRERYFVVRDDAGDVSGVAEAPVVLNAALAARAAGDTARAARWLALVEDETDPALDAARAVYRLLDGAPQEAERALRQVGQNDPRVAEAVVNRAGYLLLQTGRAEPARDVFALNTRVFPDSSNVWDSFGEALAALGATDEAIRAYEKSLALDARNTNATDKIAELREASAPPGQSR